MSATEFDPAICMRLLGNDADSFHLVVLPECDSTNTCLMQKAEQGAASGTVVVAECQTAGRGRRDRVWISTPEDSMVFSLLWRFDPASRAPEALSLVVGLALQRAINSIGADVEVKWPNDILYHGKKLAGVLIEVQPGDIKAAIIGIGINLRLPTDMPEDIAASATALDRMLASMPEREQLLAMLLTQLSAVLHRYEVDGFAGLRDEWQAVQAFRGDEVRITGGGEDIVGICRGVNVRGELLLSTDDGLRTVMTGDVSLRRAA